MNTRPLSKGLGNRAPVTLKRFRAALVAMTLLPASSIWAQTTEESETMILEEVVVTVQRRETLLQDTPASVLALGSETIDRLRITNIESLTAFVPGLKLDGNDPTEMRISLRGAFTSADTPSTEQSVGVFVDGIYLGHTGDLTSNLYDIERVEVMRGPQGTLWGRNVVGGAINIVTKNPGDETEVDVIGTLGNYDRREIFAKASGPLVDNTLYGLFSVNGKKLDGHTTIVDVLNQGLPDAGADLGGDNSLSFRGKLRWLPNDSAEYLLSLEYNSVDVDGPAARNIVAGGQPPLYPLPPNRFTTHQKIAGNLDREIFGISLHANWDLNFASLYSITAYRNLDAFFEEFSFDAAPVGGINLERDYNDTLFSQELRLAGETERLDWQVGLYYYRNDSDRTEFYREEVHPATVANLFGFARNPDIQAWRLDTGDTKSWAAFGQGTYAINEWLNLTLGGRYTKDDKSTRPEAFSPLNFLDPVMRVDETQIPPAADGSFHWVTAASDSWSEFTPMATLDASWDELGGFDRFMVYATYSEGFKSGGFETKTNPDDSRIPFEQEGSKSFEVGMKTTFWNSRAQFNVALYDAEYSNIQGLEQPPGQIGFSIFTSDADVKGAELELNLLPFNDLQLNLAYSFIDAEYAPGSEASSGDISGNQLPQAPRNSWSLGLNYSTDLGNDFRLTLMANYAIKDGVYFNPENNLNGYRDPVSGKTVFEMTEQEILDASLALGRGNWEVSVWAKNLLDDDYLLRAQDPFRFWGLDPGSYFAGGNLITGTWGPPKTYGVSLRWRY